jgi:hypothetical protein
MDEKEHEGEGLYNFAFEQYERYRRDNPEIARAINEFCGDTGQKESAPVKFPVFYALRNFNETGVPIPHISEQSAQKAKDELRGAGKNVLEFPMFEEFRGAIRNFIFFLDILMKTEETNLKARLLFATILRMIQIEKTKRVG